MAGEKKPKPIAVGPASTKTCLKAQSRYNEAQNQPTPKPKEALMSQTAKQKCVICDFRQLNERKSARLL